MGMKFIHPRTTQRLVTLAMSAWLSLPLAHAETNAPAAEFRRGIAVPHVMAWAPIEPAPSRSFVFPPFTQAPKALTAEMSALRRIGFDFVRLAVDPGPFLQFKGPRRDYMDRFLMDQVSLILASGLSVIVDFHPSDMHEDYLASRLTRGVATPLFQDYLGLLARVAHLLEALQSSRVALELMNEPPARPRAWAPMLSAAYSAIRGRTPRLLLVLDGGDAPVPDNVAALTPFKNDARTLFSFHYYDPYQFTHQGAPWMAARYLADVPYPARARPLQDSLDASAAVIAASDLPLAEKILAKEDVRARLESYRRSSFDRTSIASSFEQIAGWARAQDIPEERVILGEFGTIRNERMPELIRGEERAHWLRDVREEAEARRFIWSVWAYRGAGTFSLVFNESGTTLDPAVLEALGLAPTR
jgi:endoglucanase